MQTAAVRWAGRYRKALRAYIQFGTSSRAARAIALGRQAVALGLDTLDAARVHTQALTALAAAGSASVGRPNALARANHFFAETLVPLERTHRAAHKADSRAAQLTRALRRRTVEAAASIRGLQRSIAQRRAAEAALRTSTKHRVRLLRQAGRQQRRLHDHTREILSAHEVARRRASRLLHDEVAQTLLAIHIRLLALRGMAATSTERIKKEIAETRRVVKLSAQTIRQLSHESGIRHAK